MTWAQVRGGRWHDVGDAPVANFRDQRTAACGLRFVPHNAEDHQPTRLVCKRCAPNAAKREWLVISASTVEENNDTGWGIEWYESRGMIYDDRADARAAADEGEVTFTRVRSPWVAEG